MMTSSLGPISAFMITRCAPVAPFVMNMFSAGYFRPVRSCNEVQTTSRDVVSFILYAYHELFLGVVASRRAVTNASCGIVCGFPRAKSQASGPAEAVQHSYFARNS